MNKTLKKTLSIILTILMIVTTVPFAFAADTVTVYLKNTAGWNSNVNAFCWNNSDFLLGNWPGTAMTAVDGEDDLYTIDVPTDIYAVIFNDGSSIQTPDLFLPTDGSNCYDNGTGEWYKLEQGDSSEQLPEEPAGDGTPLTIDLSEVASSYIDIGNGYDYYDEDGYIITGTNTNVVIYIYDSCDITFNDMSANDVRLWGDTAENVTVTLDGDNYLYGGFNVGQSHLTINGDDDDTLTIESGSAAFSTYGKPGSLTVNGGKINAVTETTDNNPTIACSGGFTLNGGEFTASNNYLYVIDDKTVINGGTLNVISTSPEYAAIYSDIEIAKGALLTASVTYKVFNTYCNITPVNEAEENLSVFARFDTESDFAPVYDIKAAIEDKTYAEIKVDTHEHDLDNYGKCVCGYKCPHENIADGKCDDCGAEVTIVTITMNDGYGDGWNGNSIIIKQLVDGVYTEVATATIEDGASETYTAVLPKDGVYAFRWVSGSYSEECSFTVTVNGETGYECADGSTLTDGKVFYVTCEHSLENGICSKCGLECGVDFEHEVTDYTCTVCGKYFYAITHQPTEAEPYVELNDDTGATYQWYIGEYPEIPVDETYCDTIWYGSYADGKWVPEDGVINFSLYIPNKGDVLTITTNEEFDGFVGYYNEDAFAQDGNVYTYVAKEDNEYVDLHIYGDNLTEAKVELPSFTYTAIDGETAAELKNPEFGKKYACEVTFGDGTKEMSDAFEYIYAITHQPTEAEPYVELNDDTNASYQWYSVVDATTEITDENASGDWQSLGALFNNSVYEDGKWIADNKDSSMQFYFMVDLEAGDIINFEFASEVEGIIFRIDGVGAQFEVGDTKYSITVEEAGTYWLMTPPVEYVRAYIGSSTYTAVNGQTTDTLTPSALGKYACEVTFADGTTEMSDTFEVTHICDFSGEWKYDSSKHWKECACGLIAEEANHEFEDYTVTTPADCENNAWETGYCECGETDEREVPDSALGHTPSGWWAKNETEHWRYCVNDSCSEEIEGTRAEHSYTWKVTTEATATEDGEETGTCECGYKTTRVIPATGETPEQPDTPDEPADDICDHICHSNNALMKFLWKIISFFYRLFNIQQYCDCGVIHYDTPVFG